MLNKRDISVLRELAKEYAEAASLPLHAESVRLWNRLNNCAPERPMVLIDQECWNEMGEEFITPSVGDGYWAQFEITTRRTLYRWNHYPVDMALNPYISLPRPFHSTGFGIEEESKKLIFEEKSEITSRFFENQIRGLSDVGRIRPPVVTLDNTLESRIKEEAQAIFGGIIPFKMQGKCLHLGAWDMISSWMGVENCYIELIDRPELMHALIRRVTDCMLAQIDAMNELELVDVTGNKCHCSATFLEGLSSSKTGGAKGISQNAWAFGMAQLFTAASPSVTEEFEVEYQKSVFERFESIYYGCCERLDDRLDIIAKLPNVKKISCSPWNDKHKFCESIPDGVVVSCKPNPALLAGSSMDEEAVRKEIREAISAAAKFKRPLELILKDLTTIGRDPSRLKTWAAIAMEEVCR